MTLAVAPQSPATQQFVVIGSFNVGNPQDITSQMTWISADPKVATVDAKGVATATGAGRVIVTAQIFVAASQKTLQTTTVLSVVPQLTSITVNPASAQIAKETAQQFTAIGSFNDGSQADITALAAWSSSQPAATVSSSPGTQGLVLGIAPGSTNITASLGSLTSTPASLKVTNANLVSVAVTPANSSVPLSRSQQFAATGSFDDGTKQDIANTATWSSSNVSVARVTSAGLVQGRGLGNAEISATMGGVSDTTVANVDASSVARIAVIPASKVASNTKIQLQAMAIFNDGSSLDVTSTPGIAWSSSNSAIATIDPASGLASATGPGAATISAKLGSQTGTATLNVSDATIQSLAVAPNHATIAPGTTQNIIALATFKDSSGTFQQDISRVAAWSSDNSVVATPAFVNGLQEVAQGVAPGAANISASFSDAHGNLSTSSVVLNVNNATLSGINVAPGNAGITLNGGRQFSATGMFSDGTQQDLTLSADWGATNGAIAFLGRFGFAEASGPGQTSVTATLGGQTGSSSLLVNPGRLVKIDICPAIVTDPLKNCPVLDPESPPPAINFPKIVPYGLIAIGTFTGGSREDLTGSVQWSSSNPSIATTSDDPGIPNYTTGIAPRGVATGLVSGHVTLTATAGSVSGTSDVIVTDATPAILTVTPMNGLVQLGLTQQCEVTATFSDNSTQVVTPYVRWKTSDAAVVVVYPGGLAYPSGIGTATITAVLGNVAGSTTLTVH